MQTSESAKRRRATERQTHFDSVGGVCNGKLIEQKEEQITYKKTGKTCEAESEGKN